MTFGKGVDPARDRAQSTARSSLLRGWFPCARAVLSLAQTHRGRPQTTSTRLYAGGELQGSPVWQALAGHKRRIPLVVVLPRPARGAGTLIPPRAALSLGGQATAWECSPGRSLCLTKSSSCGTLWQVAHPRPLSLRQRGLAPRSNGKARAELRPARRQSRLPHSRSLLLPGRER